MWLDFAPWDAYYVCFQPSAEPQRVDLVAGRAPDLEILSQDAAKIVVRAGAPAGPEPLALVMAAGGRTYRGQAPAGPAAPVTLAGPWDFRPEPDRVPSPYARVRDLPEPGGAAAGLADPALDDSAWAQLWLSEAQNTLRDWNLLGPLGNTEDEGFYRSDPPEGGFQAEARYPGLEGRQVGWQRYFGSEPYLAKGLIWMETGGGPWDDDAAVVDLGRALNLGDTPWATAYAQTWVHSPVDQDAVYLVAADNWAKVWLDRKLVFGQLRHPFWYETNDNWADRIPVKLRKGWNEVLVKAGVGRAAATGTLGFTFRVADGAGRTLPDVFCAVDRHPVPEPRPGKARRWYRLDIPPGTVAVVPPTLTRPCRLYVNGRERPVAGGLPVDFRELLGSGRNVLALETAAEDRLTAPLQFVSGTRPFELQPWTRTGLAQFSGTALYGKTFTVPAAFKGKRVLLDLGGLSTAVEVRVNGREAGTLVWSPYRLDLTPFLVPGENRLQLRVTNTEANARAVGSNHSILPKIDQSGLEGPVRLVPWETVTFTLKRD